MKDEEGKIDDTSDVNKAPKEKKYTRLTLTSHGEVKIAVVMSAVTQD